MPHLVLTAALLLALSWSGQAYQNDFEKPGATLPFWMLSRYTPSPWPGQATQTAETNLDSARRAGFISILEQGASAEKAFSGNGSLKLDVKLDGPYNSCRFREALPGAALGERRRFEGKLFVKEDSGLEVTLGVLCRFPGYGWDAPLQLRSSAMRQGWRLFDCDLSQIAREFWEKRSKEKLDLNKVTISGWFLNIGANAFKGESFNGGKRVTAYVDDIRVGPQDEAALVFSDNFDSGRPDSRWLVKNGKWQIKDGSLSAEGPAQIVLDQDLGQNLRLEYTAWTDGGVCDLSSMLDVDSGAVNPAGTSGYLFGFGARNNSRNNICRKGGELARSMMEGFDKGIRQGKRHHVVAQRDGQTLTLSVDGEKLLETKDAWADEMTGKRVGFYIFAVGNIDDVKVFKLPDTKAATTAKELPLAFSFHEGFESDSPGAPPAKWKLSGNPAKVADSPTWVYQFQPGAFCEKTVKDQLVALDGEAALERKFTPLSSGILEFDFLAKRLQGKGARISLLDAKGAELAALLIDGEGRFKAATGKGEQNLLDTIAYRRRYCEAPWRCKPDRWLTLRLRFDCEAGYVLSVDVLNLFPEFKSSLYKRGEVDQGDIFSLGEWLPLAAGDGKVAGIRVAALDNSAILLDNLCLLGPVGSRTVNGKDLRLSARDLLGVDFPLRKDPFDIKTYSLRNLSGKSAGACVYSTYGVNSGASYDFLHNPANTGKPQYEQFKNQAAMRYNRLLVAYAYLEERLRMLSRTAFELGQPDQAAAAGTEAEHLLRQTYAAYAAAFLDGLNVTRLDQEFTPLADKLELALREANHLVDACLAPGPRLDCPLPAPKSPLVWRDGKWLRDGQPDFLFLDQSNMRNPKLVDTLRAPGSDKMGAIVMWMVKCEPFDYLPYAHLDNMVKEQLAKGNRFAQLWTWDGTHHCDTIVPEWWYEQNKDERDLFWMDADGKVNPSPYFRVAPNKGVGETVGLNYWNAKAQQFIRDKYEAVGRWVASNAAKLQVRHINLGCEGVQLIGGELETGHNPSAKEAFREYLKREHRSVDKLNRDWGTKYASFADISPLKEPTEPCGLQYDFQRFRQEGYYNWVKSQVASIHKHAPDVAVGSDFQEILGGDGRGGFDVPGFFDANDYVSFHTYTHDPWKLCDRWLDSLRKACGKQLNNHEAGMSQACPELFEETVYKNWETMKQFHRMMWGQSMSALGGTPYGYGDKCDDWVIGGERSEPRLSMTVLRYSATNSAIVADRALRCGRPALQADTVQPEIGILEATSSYYNAMPLRAVRKGMYEVALRLERSGYNYGFFYEQLLLDGRQSLRGVQTIVLSNATCLPEKLSSLLQDWTAKGGTLICLAPPGVYDQYGQSANKLLDAAFPGVKWRHKSYNWEPFGAKPPAPMKTLDALKVYQGKLGGGDVYVFSCVEGFDTAAALAESHTRRGFHCADNRFDLCMRQAGGTRYLYVLNTSSHDTLEDRVVIEGNTGEIVDKGLQRPVALKHTFDGRRTSLKLRLAPAEGTLLEILPAKD